MLRLLSKDAERFFQFARLIKSEQLTVAEAARRMEVNPGTLRSTISKISEGCGESVVESAGVDGYQATLTNMGLTVLDRIGELVRPIESGDESHSFTISVSQTMLTSGLLDGLLASLRSISGSFFRLRAKTRMAFREVLDGLVDREIDFAIVWGVDQRLVNIPAEISFKTLSPKIDVVVIANDRDVIEKINPAAHWFNPNQPTSEASDVIASAMRQLDCYRCAMLPKDSQAAINLIPEPDSSMGGQCIEVDTIEAAISFVRCTAADYSIVPAIYGQLEREQQEGKIVFSDPIAQIPIVVLFRRSLETSAQIILDNLFDVLEKNRSIAAWRTRKIPTDKFPRAIGFYKKLRYGYYIGADAKEPHAPVEWCWESIRLSSESSEQRRVLSGSIINQFNARFQITHAEFRDTFFVAQVKRVGRGSQSTKEFLSRFHYCDFQRGVICGTWSGNARDNRPGVFATVWSHEKLDLHELTEIMRVADLHSVMSASHGCEDKDKQLDLVGPDPCDDPSLATKAL